MARIISGIFRIALNRKLQHNSSHYSSKNLTQIKSTVNLVQIKTNFIPSIHSFIISKSMSSSTPQNLNSPHELESKDVKLAINSHQLNSNLIASETSSDNLASQTVSLVDDLNKFATHSEKTEIEIHNLDDQIKQSISKVDEVEQNSSENGEKVEKKDEGGQKSSEDGKNVKEEVINNSLNRIKRRKMVIMLSYCGQNYYGMQLNTGFKTIEGDLLSAMFSLGYIDKEAMIRPQSYQFQRAARTDKSVSAARQIISLKGPENLDIEKVNELLPPCIRIQGIKRVTQGFDAKINCDARTYSYMMPTFAFAPPEEIITEGYRITPEVLERLNKLLRLYVGTKNFHNFTSRKRVNDPSAMRHILSFTSTPPFEKDGLEYVVLRVKGQSFMMHQIRKMIGLVTAIMRGFSGDSIFKRAFGKEKIDVPKSPGVGLLLEEVHYTRYDARYGSDGMHVKITWEEEKDNVEKFLDEFIYPVVTKAENEEKSMWNWLSTLIFHTYEVRPHEEIGERVGYSPFGKAYLKANVHEKNNDGKNKDDDDKCDKIEENDEDDEGPSSAKKIKV